MNKKTNLIDFSKNKILQSIDFIFNSNIDRNIIYSEVSDLKKFYYSIMYNDSILKEDRLELSKFLSSLLRTKIRDWLFDFLIKILSDKKNKSVVNNLSITNQFVLNKNNISTVCYFFIDLMEFNCSFFDIFFEIVNLDNRVEDTLFLINNSKKNIINVFDVNYVDNNNIIMDYMALKKNVIQFENNYCFQLISDKYFFIQENNNIIINDIFKVFLDLFFSLQVNDIFISDENDIKNQLNNLLTIYKN